MVMTDTTAHEPEHEAPEPCGLWGLCVFSAGHVGVCRDAAGDPDPATDPSDRLAVAAEEEDKAYWAARAVEHPEVLPARREQPETAHHSALERAAEMALTLPQIPGRDEFLALAAQARIMASSQLVPRSLQGKPHDVFLVLLTGRDLGLPITTSIRKVYVIDGQVSVAPLLKGALIRRHGLGSIEPHPTNKTRRDGAIAVVKNPAGEVVGETEFTWADAIEGGYVRADCKVGTHSADCAKNRANKNIRQQNDSGVANYCKDNWRKNPGRMSWWRAYGQAVDDWYPEASAGIYDPDELGAVTDDDGNLIDPATVALPDGFEPRGAKAGGVAAEPVPADDEEKQAIKRRIDALSAEHFDADPAGTADGRSALETLKLLWQARNPETGERREGVDPLPPWHSLFEKQMQRAVAMVKSVEDRARKGEWGAWTPPADPETGEVNPDPAAAVAPADQEQAVAAEPAEPPDAMQVVVDAVKAMRPEEIEAGLRDRHLDVADDPRARQLALTDALYREAGGPSLGVSRPERRAHDADPADSAATAPPAAQEAPAEMERPDTAETPAGASQAPTADEVEAIIEEVKAMEPGKVMAELALRALETTGNVNAKRSRLAEAILRERIAADGSAP